MSEKEMNRLRKDEVKGREVSEKIQREASKIRSRSKTRKKCRADRIRDNVFTYFNLIFHELAVLLSSEVLEQSLVCQSS